METRAIKDLYERKRRALLRHPAFGRTSAAARVRLDARAGGVCEVEGRVRTLRVALPVEDGGDEGAPHPGDLMRASLGACLALGYKLWGARLGVPIDAVELDLTCDFDVRGQLGVADDVAVGWQRVVVDLCVTSDAPEEEVRRVVETADRLSPMLANIAPAVERVLRLRVVRRVD